LYIPLIMKKLRVTFAAVTAILALSCSSTQIGLKENWIDERDVIALKGVSVSKWMETAGRPTLVEINGDTSVYYYNYKPTMYAVAQYDSTTFFTTWGKSKESKPTAANATEMWGNRKNVMQIKVVNDIALSAIITEGPDKRTFVRDLNGELVLDPSSGYNSNLSDEQKINRGNKEYTNAYNSLNQKYTWTSKYNAPNEVAEAVEAVPETNSEAPAKNPWDDYRYRQQKSEERAEVRAAEAAAESAKHANESSEPPAEAR